MIKYPLTFKAKASATPGINETWTATSHGNPPLPCAIPKEFMGPGGGYSPEDLYGLALINCVIATFKVFAEKSGFTYEQIEGSADIIIDRGEGGKPWINRIDLHLSLSGASDKAKGETLLKEAKAACIVCSSMKTEVMLTHTVN